VVTKLVRRRKGGPGVSSFNKIPSGIELAADRIDTRRSVTA
jgi:hypothetical protein